MAANTYTAFKMLGKNTELVQERVRREIMVHGAMTSVLEQYRILNIHRREEENFPSQIEYLISDSGTLSSYFYAAIYATNVDPKERLVIQDMYEALLEDLYSKKYDYIYFLPRIYTDQAGLSFRDGVRFQTDDELHIIETYMNLIFTKIHHMDNIKALVCPLHKRVETVIEDVLGLEAVNQWKRRLELEYDQTTSTKEENND